MKFICEIPNICKHAFHVPCIDQWFATHTSCPLCRSPIQEQPNAAPSLDQHRGGSSESSATNSSLESPSPREQSFGLLRNSASMALPPPPPPPMERKSWLRLKRSLSMDQCFAVINLQRINCSSASWSSSCSRDILTRSGSYSSNRSLSQFDRVSSKWLRSFSRLPVGKGSDGTILPY